MNFIRKIGTYAYLAILKVAQQCLKNANDNVPVPVTVNSPISIAMISCIK